MSSTVGSAAVSLLPQQTESVGLMSGQNSSSGRMQNLIKENDFSGKLTQLLDPNVLQDQSMSASNRNDIGRPMNNLTILNRPDTGKPKDEIVIPIDTKPIICPGPMKPDINVEVIPYEPNGGQASSDPFCGGDTTEIDPNKLIEPEVENGHECIHGTLDYDLKIYPQS